MTDEQIIKALEYCSTDIRENTCPKCAFYKKHRCSTLMLNAVSDLINRQKSEIERLTAKILVKDNINDYNTAQLRIAREELRTAKSEAIKEFVERVKETSIGLEIGDDKKLKMIVVSTVAIDNLVKEMTEDKENV
jgi:hypothetical protein